MIINKTKLQIPQKNMFLKSLFNYFSHQRWPALLWTFLIVLACTWPGKSLPEAPVIGFDKVIHVGMFVGWAFLWMMLYPKKITLLFLIGIAFGILMEVFQHLLPYERTFDWWDVLADGVGTIVGTVFFIIISRAF
jgi:VanZ family protein